MVSSLVALHTIPLSRTTNSFLPKLARMLVLVLAQPLLTFTSSAIASLAISQLPQSTTSQTHGRVQLFNKITFTSLVQAKRSLLLLLLQESLLTVVVKSLQTLLLAGL